MYFDRLIEIYTDVIIDGVKTIYMVSDAGRVINRNTGKVLKPQLDRCGYLKLRLQLPDGTKISSSIHRLVAKAFIPNPENKPTVNHKNIHNLNQKENKQDNSVENLEWATYQEQHDHAKLHGFIPPRDMFGQNNPNFKHGDDEIHLICQLLAEDKIPQREIARMFGVDVGYINGIRKKKIRTNISSLYDIDTTCKLMYHSDELKEQIKGLLLENKYTRYEIINKLKLPDIQSSYSLIGNVKQKMQK